MDLVLRQRFGFKEENVISTYVAGINDTSLGSCRIKQNTYS